MQPPHHLKNIVLIGFMGSGKSSVGRLLAGQLGFQFVDTDSLVVQAVGMSIPDIFAKHGESLFRDYESEALASLFGQMGLIVASGGGIVTRESNVPLLHQIGIVVNLKADESILFERVSRNNNRPLLQTENPRATISKLLTLREPMYTAAAHFTVDTSTKSHAQVAAEIIQAAQVLTSS